MKKAILLFAVSMAFFCVAAEYPYAVPGFESASIYASAGKNGARLEFRQAESSQWMPAQNLVLSPDKKELRGCLFQLTEGSEYEFRIFRDGKIETGRFTTQSTKVPIAKTIILNKANFKGHLKLIESGTETGYIRYTAEPGTVLNADFKHKEAILAEKVRYVILDGLTIRGGGHHIIHLKDCENFRIQNCDLGDYGIARMPFNFLPEKTDAEHAKSLLWVNGKYVQNQAPIAVYGGKNILIERNFLHDPRCHANSWFYTHPWGPSGIHYGRAVGLTIRWNDIIGSDHHRWNDVIESYGNNRIDGGPNADAEIYGNYLAFCNDDAIELDGGQKNIRFFDNWMEGTFCGVSTAPCMEGPSYIFNNLRIRPGGEFEETGASLKNGNFTYYTGRIHVYANTFFGNGSVSGYNKNIKSEQAQELKSILKNNLFVNANPFYPDFWKVRNEVDYNIFSGSKGKMKKNYPKDQGEHEQEGNFPLENDWKLKTPIKGEKLANVGEFIGASGNLPIRPLALETSAMSMNLSSEKLSDRFLLKSTGYSGEFRIVQPDFSPFFKVTPAEGKIEAGKTLELTVTALPAKAPEARKNSGAFLIRTPNGLSRPVSVYFDTRNDLAKTAAMRKNMVYGQVVQEDDTNYTLKFASVPQGEYYIAVRMTRMPWKIFHARPGEELISTGLKRGVAMQRTGWAIIPWTAHWSYNFPRRISGEFTMQIRVQNAYSKLLGCALVKTPEEILSAAETVLPNEKAIKVIVLEGNK